MTLDQAMRQCLEDKGIKVATSSCLWVCEAAPGQLWIHSERGDGKLDSQIVLEQEFFNTLNL